MSLVGSGIDLLKNLAEKVNLSQFAPFMSRLQRRSGGFDQAGRLYLDLFQEYGGLEPGGAVLDIGCGPGRMANQMTEFIDSTGSYCGIDVVKSCVRHCNREFGSGRSNFHFSHMDVYNGRYNKRGKLLASEYEFPYPDASFDFIILISVFTHMLEKDTSHYISEISRLLAPSGRAFMTFFLLDEERAASISRGESRFKYPEGTCYVQRSGQPEFAVAYPVTAITDLLAQSGLDVLGQVNYGSWNGERSGLEFQDIVVAAKA